jgi:F0F1-type ATP synthase membrane subunit b/b'
METATQSLSLDDSSETNSSMAGSTHSLSEEEEEGVESTISRQQTDMNSEYEKMIEELEAAYFQTDSPNN